MKQLTIVVLFPYFAFAAQAAAQSDVAAIGVLFDEQHVAESSVQVCRDADDLEPSQAYQYLRKWVLPNDSHLRFRISTEFTDSVLVSPAFKLVEAAKEVRQLGSLRKELEQLKVTSELDDANRNALLMLVAIEEADEDEATSKFQEFSTWVASDKDRLEHVRSALLVCTYQAARSGKTRGAVLDVVVPWLSSFDGVKRRPTWLVALRNAVERLRAPHEGEGKEPTADFKQWHAVSRSTAYAMSQRLPHAAWTFQNAQARKTVANSDDFLFFASPLQGDFEVQADTQTLGAESQLLVDGVWAGLRASHKECDIGRIRGIGGRRQFSGHLSDTFEHGIVRTRVAHRNGTSTTYFNGNPVLRQSRLKQPYPWLAIRSHAGVLPRVSDLRISGNPTIPDQISLVESKELLGWYDFFQRPGIPTLNRWQGEVANSSGHLKTTITATRQSELAQGCHAEQLLVYARPMLEDGTISYDFWYEPGKSVAHPAIGRTCFLLSPYGIDLHQVTLGRYEKSNLRADNRQSLLKGPIPIRAGDWNTIQLQVKADRVAIVLNDLKLVEYELTARKSDRKFGLFYFSDQSELKVRNPIWEGSWPKRLPAVPQQELAKPDVPQLEKSGAALPETLLYRFDRNSLQDGTLRPMASSRVGWKASDDGLLISAQGMDGYKGYYVAPNLSAGGDFDITMKFADFDRYAEPGRVANIGLDVVSTDRARSTASLQLSQDRGEDQIAMCCLTQRIKGDTQYNFFGAMAVDALNGRLRLSRRGKKLHFLLAENDSTQFRLFQTKEFNDTTIQQIKVGILLEGPGGYAKALFKEIDVRAERIYGTSTRPSVVTLDSKQVSLEKLNAEREKLKTIADYDLTKVNVEKEGFFRWPEGGGPKSTKQGLLIEAPGSDRWYSTGVGLPHRLTGDFDMSMFFDFSQAKPGDVEKMTQAIFELQLEDTARTRFGMAWAKASGGERYCLGKLDQTKAGARSYLKIAMVPFENDIEYLRLARRGNLVYCLAGDELGKERVVAHYKLNDSSSAPNGIRALLHPGHSTGTSKIRVTRIVVQGEEFRGATPIRKPQQRRRSIFDGIRELFGG